MQSGLTASSSRPTSATRSPLETALGRVGDSDARITVEAGVVADIDRLIAQIDGAVERATAKGRTGVAPVLADQERKTRAELAAQRTTEEKALAEGRGDRHQLPAQGGRPWARTLSRGPTRAGDQDILRWFILVVALLVDPAAVLLLLAASSGRVTGHGGAALRCEPTPAAATAVPGRLLLAAHPSAEKPVTRAPRFTWDAGGVYAIPPPSASRPQP
jgi:hypothetical protein